MVATRKLVTYTPENARKICLSFFSEHIKTKDVSRILKRLKSHGEYPNLSFLCLILNDFRRNGERLTFQKFLGTRSSFDYFLPIKKKASVEEKESLPPAFSLQLNGVAIQEMLSYITAAKQLVHICLELKLTEEQSYWVLLKDLPKTSSLATTNFLIQPLSETQITLLQSFLASETLERNFKLLFEQIKIESAKMGKIGPEFKLFLQCLKEKIAAEPRVSITELYTREISTCPKAEQGEQMVIPTSCNQIELKQFLLQIKDKLIPLSFCQYSFFSAFQTSHFQQMETFFEFVFLIITQQMKVIPKEDKRIEKPKYQEEKAYKPHPLPKPFYFKCKDGRAGFYHVGLRKLKFFQSEEVKIDEANNSLSSSPQPKRLV